MSGRSDPAEDELAAARAIVRGMIRDLHGGKVMPDGGPTWQLLRRHAFRYFVVLPTLRSVRTCLRAVRGSSHRERSGRAAAGRDAIREVAER
jgi:hypothetical protein